MTVFETYLRIWSALSALDPEEKAFCLKVFVEFSLSEVISLYRESEIRLIYLRIPPHCSDNWEDNCEVKCRVNLLRIRFIII